MRIIDANPSMPQLGRFFVAFWRKSKAILIVSTLLGLVSLNVLTLLNDAIHAAGYNALRAILAPALSDAALSRMLSDSPTAVRKREVKTATKAFANENARLAASNKTIEKKRIALEKANIQIRAENSKLKSITEERSLTAQKISKRLVARSLANATRNAASVAGEVIPVVGTAIILSVTAWDIYDACETMKDVNELNSAFGHPQEDKNKVCGMKVPLMNK